MNICCDNSQLVKKQRDEIVLMTNQLQDQEEQLNNFHAASLKQKEDKKGLETKLTGLEKVINLQKIEISKLKGLLFG